MIMEKRMTFVLKLSLEEIALRKVLVILWNERDILAAIGKFRFRNRTYRKEWWKAVGCRVADKVSELQLPESLKGYMKQQLRPIGLEILRWKLFHEDYLTDLRKSFKVPILSKLCWTSAGTIDYLKTAEELVRCEAVSLLERYKLACLYCLDDYIAVFWNSLPAFDKTYFYVENVISHIEAPNLEFCWPYILEGEESKLDYLPGRRSYGDPVRFQQYAFEYSASRGNKPAAEFFYQKLSLEEREASLILTAQLAISHRNRELHKKPDDFPKEKVNDVLCYLLSLMTHEQQMQIFQENPCEVFRCFLDWPWQDFLLDFADVMWSFLPETNYDDLLRKWTRSIKISGYYLPSLFQNFFLRSPNNFKKYFVERESQYSSFFPEFFDLQDTDTIQVIFRNIDAPDRLRLVTSEDVFIHFYNSILNGRWHTVEVCLREATLSKEDRERLKRIFMEFLKKIDRGQVNLKKPKWRKFFEFLDENDAIAPKRSLNDDASTEAKKLYCKDF